MKVQYILGITICFIISFLSCTKHDESTSKLLPELVKAEEIMYESPDSALHILQTMTVPSPSDKLQYSTWALFMTQAKYKLYISQTDSLIDIAYSYFMQHNCTQRKAMVLYYKAALYKEYKKYEDAQNLYLKAIEEAEKTDDYQLCYLIYNELGDIYSYRSLPDYAEKAHIQGHNYALKSQNYKYIINSSIHIARVFEVKKDLKQAVLYYQQAIQAANMNHEYNKAVVAMAELANIYNKLGENQLALTYIKDAISLDNEKNKELGPQKYLILGKTFNSLNQIDSAYLCLQNLLIEPNINIYTLENAYVELYLLLQKKGECKKAIKYLEEAWGIHDSIHQLEKKETLIEMQEKYNQQKVLNEKNKLELRKNKLIHKILLILIIVISLSVFLIYSYQKKIIKKERQLQDAESKIRSKSIQIKENEQTISLNQIRIEELHEEIKKNENKREQIEEQVATLTEIQKRNEYLLKENNILQNEIDSISSTLKEKSMEVIRLEKLSEENLYLHERQNFLSSILVQKNELINKLKKNPKYIEVDQWSIIRETIDFVYDDYTKRLSKLIPSLTEGDIQICCLIKLHMSNTTIATLLAISPTSVTKRKMRLKERILQEINSFKDTQTLDLWLWEF